MTNTTATAKTTRHPDGLHVSMGGVRQNGGLLPLYTCNACGAEVVWATSNRTGRKYLVTVGRNYNGARYYRGDNIHPRNCGEVRAAAVAEEIAKQDARKARAAMVLQKSIAASQRLYKAGTITKDQYMADLEMFEREYNEEMAR